MCSFTLLKPIKTMKKKVTQMKTLMMTVIAAFVASNAFAAEVGGNVNTTVKTGNITQVSSGVNNKQSITAGSVEGGKAKVGGNFKSTVTTGNITQGTSGVGNEQSITLGSVKSKH